MANQEGLRVVCEELAEALKEYRGDWNGLEHDRRAGILSFHINDKKYSFRLVGEGSTEVDRRCGAECGCSRYCEGTGKETPNLTVTVTADVGDAITGFKALQRELRKTMQEARELESAFKDLKNANFSDEDSERLAKIITELGRSSYTDK